jgi:hypothetical protein
VRNVPVDLIRRDPATQAVVRAENVAGSAWQDIDYEGTHFRLAVENIAVRGGPSKVLIAPTRAKNVDALVRVIQRLRDAGIADPA